MPRRLRVIPDLPPRVDDGMQDLRNILSTADPDQVAAWYLRASKNERMLMERILAEQASIGWRATPATMMVHLDPTKKLWPYVALLGRKFADAVHGRDPRQDWEMPSQYGKTTLAGVWGPIWALDYDPRFRIMYVSYDADKAVEEVGQARDLAEQHAEHLRFRLRPDRRSRGQWKTDQGGGLYATGIGGAITGFPAEMVIGDDLMKGWVAAHSEAERNRAWNVYKSQMRMRLQSPRNPIILAGTRWHEDDPQGRALREADDVVPFTRVRLPAIAEAPSKQYPEPDLLGRAPGEPLEAERFPLEEVQARARVLGTYLASAMEQQRPSPEAGTDILREWFRLDDVFPARFDQWAASWDMKLKDKESGDFVAGGVFGRTGGDFWLLDVLRGQWNQATVKAAMALIRVRYPLCRAQYVENTGNAPETMDELRKANPAYTVSADVQGALGMTDDEARHVEEIIRRGLSGLIAVNPKGDKRVRARAVSPTIEAGNVHLPKPRDASPYQRARGLFVEDFLAEVAAFPNGTHDDQVDMLSQALSQMSHTGAVIDTPDQTPIQRPSGRTIGTAPQVPMPWQRGRR